jgi:hypothetical protein
MAQKRISRAGQVEVPPTQRIATSFKDLATSSRELNSAAAELHEVVSVFEKHLLTIKPHVATWYEIASGEDDSGARYWNRSIGFANINGTWGIGLRTEEGHVHSDFAESEAWLFKDAPQWMQIESVTKLPDLLEEIVKRTQETTKKLRAKTERARALAEALSKAVEEEAAVADLL